MISLIAVRKGESYVNEEFIAENHLLNDKLRSTLLVDDKPCQNQNQSEEIMDSKAISQNQHSQENSR